MSMIPEIGSSFTDWQKKRTLPVIAAFEGSLHTSRILTLNWVAVKELKLSYYIGETLLFTIYSHYGNLI